MYMLSMNKQVMPSKRLNAEDLQMADEMMLCVRGDLLASRGFKAGRVNKSAHGTGSFNCIWTLTS